MESVKSSGGPPKLELSDPVVVKIAQKSVGEGTVFIMVLISAKGEISKTKIKNGIGNTECERAVLTSLKLGR